MLTDAAGQPLYAWDAEDRQFHFSYDELRRPLSKEVTESSTTKVLGVIVYGEGQTSPEANNLKGQLYKNYDGAGTQTVPSYNFKGNPDSVERVYVEDYTQHPDWTTIGSVTMEGTTYTTESTIDALGRPVKVITPEGGETNYTYDKAGQLYRVDIENVRSLDTEIVNSIEYNARGQRTKIQYENGSTTTYEYDPNTFRVTRIRTTRSSDSAVLQDLNYWYDPVGNITLQRDDAQQTVFFNNAIVSPDNDYTYDALYRLIIAKGREHVGSSYNAPDHNDAGRIHMTHPQASGDAALETYIQYYEYDEVGNMLEMKHTAGLTPFTNYWTRTFDIDTDSNRLLSSTVSSVTETYSYDARGNLTNGMNHLGTMTYNAENRLEKVVINADITTYYQYDSDGQRVRKTIKNTPPRIIETRKYVGQWEVYDKTVNGTKELERESLHIMDDTARVALVDSPTVDINGTGEKQTLRYQYSNHLSTATLELDDTAAIISYEEYYPYGSTSFQSGRTSAEVSLKRYRYTGKERDEETGLYYHGARYYIPWLCRWSAVDPMENKYAGMSSYNYSLCNPIILQDSDGMDPDPTSGSWYKNKEGKTKFASDVNDKQSFDESNYKKEGGEFLFSSSTGDLSADGKYWLDYSNDGILTFTNVETNKVKMKKDFKTDKKTVFDDPPESKEEQKKEVIAQEEKQEPKPTSEAKPETEHVPEPQTTGSPTGASKPSSTYPGVTKNNGDTAKAADYRMDQETTSDKIDDKMDVYEQMAYIPQTATEFVVGTRAGMAQVLTMTNTTQRFSTIRSLAKAATAVDRIGKGLGWASVVVLGIRAYYEIKEEGAVRASTVLDLTISIALIYSGPVGWGIGIVYGAIRLFAGDEIDNWINSINFENWF